MRRTSKSLIVLGLAATLLLSTVGTALALPGPSGYGPTIDPYARYDVVAGECPPGEQPGVAEFRALLQREYGANGAGITRGCNPATRSAHQSGRAYDWMLDARRPSDAAKAKEVLDWLLATDEHGNRHAMARRLGIMYIIWDRHWWAAWDADAGWKPYSGSSPHVDHIHFSFGWAGARKETSFWTAPEQLSRTGFRDVPVGAYYEDAVAWLVDNDITRGRSADIYDPNGIVNRGQMATFLWNLMAKPAAAQAASFSDVDPDAFYADAVAWLGAEGITTGRPDGTYAPQLRVNRGQMASFLWRLVGEPAPVQPHGFPDVRPDDHYDQAAAWMVEHGITTGTRAGTFAGGEAISRAQMALFLHRLAEAPDAWSSARTVPASVSR